MKRPIRIRTAIGSDVSEMVCLLHQLFSIEQDFTPDAEKQRCGLEHLLDSRQAQLFVAEDSGRVIGMATVQEFISTAEGGTVGFVEDVVIDEVYRNQGIGKAILDHLTLWSKENGLSRLQLMADRNNLPALDFYQKQGWIMTELIGLRSEIWRSNRHQESVN